MDADIRRLLQAEEIRGEHRANRVRLFVAAVFLIMFIGFYFQSESNHDIAYVVFISLGFLLLYTAFVHWFLTTGHYHSSLMYLGSATNITWITFAALDKVFYHGTVEPEGWIAYNFVLLIFISLSGLRFDPGLGVFAGVLSAVEFLLVNLAIALANGGPLPIGHTVIIAVLLVAAGVIVALISHTARQLIVRASEAERQRAEFAYQADQARHIAVTDDLTGLHNRRHFMAELKRELARSTRYKQPFAVLIIDLDHFKQVNDTLGHLIGDLVMQQVAAILQRLSRETDIVARYGGDEFGLILCQADPPQARLTAERLCQAVREHEFDVGVDAGGRHASLSIGLACFPSDAIDEEGLLRAADRAVYEAKALGRDRVVIASSLLSSGQLAK